MYVRISVAIDGPAGAGKSTIAKILSKKLNLMYINTGAMYRAVTLKAIEKKITPENIEALSILTDSLNMYFEKDRLILNGEDVTDFITTPEISNTVSNYAAIGEIRERMVNLQRKMSLQYDVIMDGRDIGTVVLKNAAFKFFLTASPEERARRRYDELIAKKINVVYEEILQEIIKRDYMDSHREISPLVKAIDAVEIDTTGLGIESVVSKIYDYIINGIKSAE
jgi:CMP/dCMP kinase